MAIISCEPLTSVVITRMLKLDDGKCSMFRIFELNLVVGGVLRDIDVLDARICCNVAATTRSSSFGASSCAGPTVVVERLVCSDGNSNLFGRTIFLCLYGVREDVSGTAFSLVDGTAGVEVGTAFGWNFFAGNRSDRRSSGFVTTESGVFFAFSSTLKCSG